MSKISGYASKLVAVLTDKLIGSDSEDSNSTKNFTMETIKNFVSTLFKSGDVAGGNYSEFEADGTIVNHGDATTYEDLKVNLLSVPSVGANSPTRVIVANDGVTGTGGSIGFDGVNQSAYVANYSAVENTPDLSVSMWMKVKEDVATVVQKGTMWGVRKEWSSIVITLNNQDIWLNNVILTNEKVHLAFSYEYVNSQRSTLIVYVNGALVYNGSVWSSNLTTNTDQIEMGTDGVNFGYLDLDELHLYNVALTSAQILELYATGDGITTVPVGITEATELIARFHFDLLTDNDNDCTLGAGEDLVRVNTTSLEDSLIAGTGTAGSLGVSALSFPAGVTSEVFFSTQLPHRYEEGSDIEPHSHFMNPSSATGNVVWGLEYIWVNVNDTAGNTTVVDNAIAVGTHGKHIARNVAVLSGTGKKISSVLQCRLFRDGSNPLDTFTGPVYSSEFDFHFKSNTQGSRGVWTK